MGRRRRSPPLRRHGEQDRGRGLLSALGCDIADNMNTVTLARKLGTTEHISCLRMKARRFGLRTRQDLVDEAIARGCFHYLQSHEPPAQRVSEVEFSNEE